MKKAAAISLLLLATLVNGTNGFITTPKYTRVTVSSNPFESRIVLQSPLLVPARQQRSKLYPDADVEDNIMPIEPNEGSNNYYDDDNGRVRSEIYVLSQAAFIGIFSGWSVGIFKLSIDAVRRFTYGPMMAHTTPLLYPLIPALGGVAVGALMALWGAFPPGLRGTVQAVDTQAEWTNSRQRNRWGSLGFLRKTMAAVFTLGTGCSLGPEGPSVEIGMSISRICLNEFPIEGKFRSKKMRSRLLLACGAAAGVAAGFNAPIAGVFFALEIMQGAFAGLDKSQETTIATATSGNISAILLSSVLSALTGKALLGDHLVFELHEYTLRTPLLELPLYLMLGGVSGLVAFAFSQAAAISKGVFDGKAGPEVLRKFAEKLPTPIKPVIGGLLCGLVGLIFPQILFFGYETLNGLLANGLLPTTLLVSLLFVKLATTAVSTGSGLVGGTFAPSLFMGGMVGASFHNVMSSFLQFASGSDTLQLISGGPLLILADVPAYAMVGAASVLAALFRAPLTASLLLFELSRDYDVILPLMASAGVASLVNDLVEQKMEERLKTTRRDTDEVSWGDLSYHDTNSKAEKSIE